MCHKSLDGLVRMRLNTNLGLVDGVELGVGGTIDPLFLQVFMFMA